MVFADEPTGQLNSHMSQTVLDLLVALNERGQTIVMVTHDLRSAARGNRICYLRDGVIENELELPYDGRGEDERRETLARFLDGMGW